MYKNSKIIILIPLIVALSVVLGMLINKYLYHSRNTYTYSVPNKTYPSGSKLGLILNMINSSYVDSVNVNQIEEDAIPALFKSLDPHTSYISSKNMKKVREEMQGEFGGLGVQFYRYLDTVTVVNVVPEGPAYRVGILSGDRIVRVGDSLIVGKKWNNDRVMKVMRGNIGTEVNLEIYRRGEKKALNKKIKRGAIPIHSVDIAYMLNDTTAYIKVNSFMMNTYTEFMEGLEKLKGMKRLIVDLRGNPGGVLPIAINMANEFLKKGDLIVYTEGKSNPRSDYSANGKGLYQDLPISILIDEGSASASEIFAGAMQDNDRGLVIGRRSFGKGLVQNQTILSDGSAVRLTVARYYTPSGRSIQKDYKKGNKEYFNELYDRMQHGEMSVKDSIHFDKKLLKYTKNGRKVYGGGGIMPDIFVPADTSGYSKYLIDASRKNLIYDFTFDFMDKHRDEMRKLKNYKQVLNYLSRYNLVEDMVKYSESRGLKRDNKGIKDSEHLMLNLINSFIGRHTLDNAGFYPINAKTDKTLIKAIESKIILQN